MKFLEKLREDAYYYAEGDVPCDSEGNVDFSLPHRQPTEIGYMILVLVERVKHFWLESLCLYWYKDHDLEFDSWSGPDHGGETWYCRRCGVGGSHTYY